MPRLSEYTDYQVPQPEEIPADISRVYINGEQPSKTSVTVDKILNSLFRDDDKRYQLWPEKVVREGLTAAGDVYSGKTPQYQVDPETGDVHTSPQMIEKAQAISALAGTGGLGGVTDATLGATPFLRPALKYKDRLYKGKEGQSHQDVIPDALYPEFQQMAMSGEDISHYNFGFHNDKGHFLDREAALKYGIDTGIIDPQAGKFGALTSTLMADSSKPGTAIEAMAKTYPLAKPSDRWTNTLGQNDHLIQNMTPDEFLSNSRPLKIDAESRENINAIKEHIKEGKPLDPLELHANGKEDGRHRAIAAKELGIKEIPVINFRPPADPFFSALEHNVKYISQNKMTGDQWLGTLSNKPGVKPEELDWTGLKSFLQENGKAPVTKEAIEQHLAANKVELKEIYKGKLDTKKYEQELKQAGVHQDEIDYRIGMMNEGNKISTKYHSYQLPGGENYREMLLTLPTQNKMKWEKTADGITAEGYTIKKEPNGYVTYGSSGRKLSLHDSEEMAKSLVETSKANSPNTQMYRSSHWDEPNILAHVRMNDRNIDGKKSLHLEEIQSDWHQQGRDKGYKNIDSDKEFNEYSKLKTKLTNDFKSLNDDELRRYAELDNKYLNNEIGIGKGVPDAPFKKSWHELALKRMIREASEKGYDSLSWTPGEAQAARYDLSKSIDELQFYFNKDDKTKGRLYAIDKNGQVKINDAMPVAKVSDYVGKEAADKLINSPTSKTNNNSTHILENADLKIGGEGMKGFYDQIIPKAIEKIGKEHGVKVKSHMLETNPKGWHITPPSETVSGKWMVKSSDYNSKGFQFATKEEAEANLAQNIAGERAAKPIHYIDIPKSLRDTAMHKGFPLFSSTHMYIPVDHEPEFKKK